MKCIWFSFVALIQNELNKGKREYNTDFLRNRDIVPCTVTAQKMKFSIKDFFSKCGPQFPADLVAFTEVILNGKLHFLCSRYMTSYTISCREWVTKIRE